MVNILLNKTFFNETSNKDCNYRTRSFSITGTKQESKELDVGCLRTVGPTGGKRTGAHHLAKSQGWLDCKILMFSST